MNCVARIASVLLLAVSVPAAAAPDDNDAFKAKVRAAVETEVREQQQRPRQDSPAQVIREQVAANGSSSSSANSRKDRRYDPIYCGSFGDCPFGTRGAPTFDELREWYRHYPDSVLWDICLGRRPATFASGSQGACMLIASPNPWRPVDLPRLLEHDQEAMGWSPGEALPPCKALNETLNRKRPHRCAVKPERVE